MVHQVRASERLEQDRQAVIASIEDYQRVLQTAHQNLEAALKDCHPQVSQKRLAAVCSDLASIRSTLSGELSETRKTLTQSQFTPTNINVDPRP